MIFAPESALALLWATAKDLLPVRIDIERNRHVDVIADVTHLPFAAGVADLVWCHHVLEQVKDDRQAIIELVRVVKKETGQLIFSAGMSDSAETHEFATADKQLSGNWRGYGKDLRDRLQGAGLEVAQLTYGLSDSESVKYGVFHEPFFVCRRTS